MVLTEMNKNIMELSGDIMDMYPSLYVTERALEKGIKFTFGSDAHQPQSVGTCLKELRGHEVYKKALATWET